MEKSRLFKLAGDELEVPVLQEFFLRDKCEA